MSSNDDKQSWNTNFKLTEDEAEDAINIFQDILKFPTISNTAANDNSYNDCANYILHQLKLIGLVDSFILKESLPNYPIVIAKFPGLNENIGGILLNSHYDVVPVIESHWTMDAFKGIRIDKRIYGRGTQDMKCVVVQYIIAIKKLISMGFKPNRTIYLSFVPDEEIGGVKGMKILIESDWFHSIQVDLALDEGLASESNKMSVFYGERLPWWVRVVAEGNTGHGSRFIENTAAEQIISLSNKVLEYRQSQKAILHQGTAMFGCNHAVAAKTLGDVTTVNITKLKMGVESGGNDVLNVVPPTAEACFDIRISPNIHPSNISSLLDLWCEECKTSDASLKWEYVNNAGRDGQVHYTTVTNDSNQWWKLFSSILQDKLNIEIVPQIFPAATDSRFLRALGIKAFGFSPIRNSPILLHEHNEYLDEDVFIEGCNVFVVLISELSSTNF